MLANHHETLMNAIRVGENVFIKALVIVWVQTEAAPPHPLQDIFALATTHFSGCYQEAAPPKRKFANSEIRE